MTTAATTPAHRTAPPLKRPLALYAAGHAALLLGAGAMHVSGSMLPMALAASACLMLTAPIVRHLVSKPEITAADAVPPRV